MRTISATPIRTIRIGKKRAPHATAARSSALRRAFSGAGADSMITRHGRSASTVSSVLPNSDAPLTRSRQRHHDRRRAHVDGLLDDPAPGLAGAHPLDVAGHARARLHARLLDQRLRRRPPASGIGASIGSALGTVTIASTWIPRRRARGQLGRGRDHGLVVVLGAHRDEHRVVLGLVIDDRLRDRDLVRRGQVQPLPAAEEQVDDHPERSASRRRTTATSGFSTTITTNATAVKKPPAIANSGQSTPAPHHVARAPGRGAGSPAWSSAAGSPRSAPS